MGESRDYIEERREEMTLKQKIAKTSKGLTKEGILKVLEETEMERQELAFNLERVKTLNDSWYKQLNDLSYLIEQKNAEIKTANEMLAAKDKQIKCQELDYLILSRAFKVIKTVTDGIAFEDNEHGFTMIQKG